MQSSLLELPRCEGGKQAELVSIPVKETFFPTDPVGIKIEKVVFWPPFFVGFCGIFHGMLRDAERFQEIPRGPKRLGTAMSSTDISIRGRRAQPSSV